MIGREDRQALARAVDVAHAAGARPRQARETAGIELGTLQRWKVREGLVTGDGRRKAVQPMPSHALTVAECVQLLGVANKPPSSVPPPRIVPMLPDEGIYLSCESSFSRVLR